MVQLFSPTGGSQEFIAVVGSAQHKSDACCIAYRQGPGKRNSEQLKAPPPPALGTTIRSNKALQPKGRSAHITPSIKKKKQGQALHIVKLESLNCLMAFDFVPSAILVVMFPCEYIPLARLEQYIHD